MKSYKNHLLPGKRQGRNNRQKVPDSYIGIENTDKKADGMDLLYLRVYVVDSRGRVVPTATNELIFEVSGEATITTTDNGDHFTDNLFINKNRKLE